MPSLHNTNWCEYQHPVIIPRIVDGIKITYSIFIPCTEQITNNLGQDDLGKFTHGLPHEPSQMVFEIQIKSDHSNSITHQILI